MQTTRVMRRPRFPFINVIHLFRTTGPEKAVFEEFEVKTNIRKNFDA